MFFVVENFSGDDVLPDDRIYSEADGNPLTGALEFRNVEGGPSTGGLTVSGISIEPGRMVAVTGGSNGGRESFLKLAAGLAPPARGFVSMGGRALIDCSLPQIGRTVAYVGADPGIVARKLRDNVLYGLFRGAPDLANSDAADFAEMLREARLTGNTTADPEGDWVDYEQAGVDGPEALEERLMELIEIVDRSDEIYVNALGMRLDPDAAQKWTDEIMQARESLHAESPKLADIVEAWHPAEFNSNANLLENILYGLPVSVRMAPADYYDEPAVREILQGCGAIKVLCAIGKDIAKEFSDLVDAVEAGSTVLDSLAGYNRADIMAAHELILEISTQTREKMTEAEETLLVRLAIEYVQMRDRMDVLTDERIGEVLECRASARALVAGRGDFVSFNENRFSPARTIAGNIVHGKRRFDRRAAWKKLDEMLKSAIDTAGLRDDLILLGLNRPIPSANILSVPVRRRIALVRAMIKQPQILVLDGIAGGDGEEDVRLRTAIRQDLPGATILYAALEDEAIQGADLVIRIADNGEAVCEAPANQGKP